MTTSGLALVTAVVPVKPLRHAKSRLLLAPEQRQALALAFAVDTVSALLACRQVGEVLVVTADTTVEHRLRPLGARLARDGGGGLGAAVAQGTARAARRRPDAGVVVVPADLPCLRPGDLEEVLALAAGAPGAFVPDRAGTGTTVLVQPPGVPVTAAYGPGSAARHRLLGLRPLDDAPVRARHDVDTVDDLRAAKALGVGPCTAGVPLGVGPLDAVAY